MIPDPLMPAPFVPADAASTALGHLGLDAQVLMDAVLGGVRAAQNITPDHPVTARGFTQWSETVAALRASLLESGWTKEDPQNSPRIISPEQAVSIMVVGGNGATGRSVDIEPGTARRRGPMTTAAVEVNVQQTLDLPGLESASPDPTSVTWVLLYHVSYSEGVARAELSLPDAIEDGNISHWQARIILPSQHLAGVDIPFSATTPEDDVDFTISENT